MTDDTLSDNILDDDIEEVQESTESGPGQYEHWRMTVDAGQQPVRIDKFLAEHMQHSSRNRIQTAADAGCIQRQRQACEEQL
jgi:23S rRNA pseudouridine1911/1915/1917 synthase